MSEVSETGWKESEFNFFVTALVRDCILFFNSRTGAFRALDRRTWGAVETVLAGLPALRQDMLADMMRGTGMVVPESLDERASLERNYLAAKPARGLTLTITPTVSCNFGCHYCFQSHSKDRMSERDDAAIMAFVGERLSQDSYLSVTWFGGEPLTQLPFIGVTSEKLRALAEKRGSRYSHSIITNGFLLNAKARAALAEMHPFSYVQITLDGGRTAHDRRRMLLSGKGTYDTILSNIEAAAGLFPIHIRVNVDRSNMEFIEPLVDDFIGRGLHRRGVHIYLAHTRPYTEHSQGIGEAELTKEEFADLALKFDYYLFERGVTGTFRLPRPRTGTICTADTEGSYVISPGGKLFKCWNDAANPDPAMAAALIDGSGSFDLNRQNTEPWEGHNPYRYKACATCKVQPLCKGGCPWEARKNTEDSIGDCSAYRWTLPDRLRLHHLQETLAPIELGAA